MIKTKSGGESQNASLIKPINGDSYCISKTHLRVEVNTFVMVMIMALNAHLRCGDMLTENFFAADTEGHQCCSVGN